MEDEEATCEYLMSKPHEANNTIHNYTRASNIVAHCNTGAGAVSNSRPRWTWRLVGRLVGLYVGMVPAGMSHAVLGAVLLELGQQTDTGVEKLALLFTWNFIGRLISSFTVSAIFDRIHPEMQLGVASLVFIVTVSMIPITQHYGVVSASIAIMGSCAGYLMTGSTSTVFFLFADHKSPGPFIQANYFAISVGSMLAPLIAKPFLSPEAEQNVTDNGYNTTLSTYSTDNRTHQVTFGKIKPGTFYPFIIIGAVMLIPAMLFWCQFVKDKCNAIRSTRVANHAKENNDSKDPVVIMLLFFAFYCTFGIEVTFSGLLYTYAVKGCNWDQQSASQLIIVFWLLYTVTRGISIPVTKIIGPGIILAVSLTLLVAMMVVMAAASHISPVVLWTTAAGNAVAMSPQLGTWFVAGNELFPISGRMTGLFMAAVYIGGMTVPALTGYLFKSVHPSWMCYVLLILSVALLMDYVTIQIYRKYKPGREGVPPPQPLSEDTQAMGSVADQPPGPLSSLVAHTM